MSDDGRGLDCWLRRGLFRLMRMLPSEWASDLGVHVVKANVRANRPDIPKNARANLRIHRPDATEAELDAMIEAFLETVGRTMGEYAVIHRFVQEGRLETHGLEAFQAIAGKEPILAMGLHTGNWETFSAAFQMAGIQLTSFYFPPVDAFEREVALKIREHFGAIMLSPDPAGVRTAMKLMRENRIVAIFPDEARFGVTMGPLFGRPPHEQGNLSIATRLARHARARIVICHSERIGKCRFRLVFGEPITLPERAAPDRLADIAFLNSHVEPIIARNIPRWYFLDDSIGPIAPKT